MKRAIVKLDKRVNRDPCNGCGKCGPLCRGDAVEMVTQPCGTHGKTTW